VQPVVAARRNGAVARGIDHDAGYGRLHLRHAHHGAAGNAFARERRQDAVADIVVRRSAERGGKLGVPTEARDGDRRIGGAAADHGKERIGARLGVGGRKAIDEEHLIQHGHSGADDVRRPGLTHAGPRPSSTQARMM
jgi:hypothetical protein